MSTIYTIYLHKNKINNKVQVGQTRLYPPEKRWREGLGYKKCTYFNYAIEKYGWNNFEHIILVQKEMTQEEANEMEEQYIKFYDSTNLDKGYNIKEKASSISSNASPAGVKWMKQHPEWCKEKVKDCLKWQKEHPKEILQQRLNNVPKMNKARKRPVICIETGIIYESATEAAKHNSKTSQSKICMACRGQRITCGGYHWKYLEDQEKENE